MGIATQIIGLIACLAFLVITHEFGHYCFARIFKTRVDKFYMFFNPGFSILRAKRFDGKWHFSFFSTQTPESWNEHPDNTEWGLGWLPLGGYCSINGMVDETTKPGDLPAEPQPWEFRAKPAWQRLFIILGGVLVNFITALILYVIVLFAWGEDYIPVDNAKYGMHYSQVAQEAGFQNGDQIFSIDGTKPEKTGDITGAVLIDGAQRVVVNRNKSIFTGDSTNTQEVSVKEKVTVYLDKHFAQRLIGSEKSEQYFCQFEMPFILDSVPSESPAAKAGLQRGDSLVGLNGVMLFSFYDYQKELAKHKSSNVTIAYIRDNQIDTTNVKLDADGKLGVFPVTPVALLGLKHVDYGFVKSIPNGISKGFTTLGDYVKQFKLVFTKEGATQLGGFGTIGSIFPKVWDWQIFWNMTAFLAIVLAFMNFLPIPALDGGYILFILVEIITRRKPSDKFIGYANTVGFILLLALLIYANGLDVLRAFK